MSATRSRRLRALVIAGALLVALVAGASGAASPCPETACAEHACRVSVAVAHVTAEPHARPQVKRSAAPGVAPRTGRGADARALTSGAPVATPPAPLALSGTVLRV